jgi:hypothetical protein
MEECGGVDEGQWMTGWRAVDERTEEAEGRVQAATSRTRPICREYKRKYPQQNPPTITRS